MRKLFKERKLFKGGNYMRKYGIQRKSTTVWNLKMVLNFRWGRRGYLRRWWGWAPFLPPSGGYRKIRSNWNCCYWTWMWITRCPWNLCLHSKRTLFYQMGNPVQSKILFIGFWIYFNTLDEAGFRERPLMTSDTRVGRGVQDSPKKGRYRVGQGR